MSATGARLRINLFDYARLGIPLERELSQLETMIFDACIEVARLDALLDAYNAGSSDALTRTLLEDAESCTLKAAQLFRAAREEL